MGRAVRLTDGEYLLLAGVLYQAQKDAAKGRPCSHQRCVGDVHACGDDARAFLGDDLGRAIQTALRDAPKRVQTAFLEWVKEAK